MIRAEGPHSFLYVRGSPSAGQTEFPKELSELSSCPRPTDAHNLPSLLFSLPVERLQEKSPTSFLPLSLFSLFGSLHLYTDTTFVVFPIDLLVKSSGQFTVCIFVDLVATFDTMNHCLSFKYIFLHFFPSIFSWCSFAFFGFLLSFLQRNFLEQTPLCLSQSPPTVSPLITNLPPKLHHVYFCHL